MFNIVKFNYHLIAYTWSILYYIFNGIRFRK